MKYSFDLLAVPNQRFDTTLNGVNITIELVTSNGLCYLSIIRDGSYIAAGVKCVPNIPLLSAENGRIIGGNISFECLKDEYPSYEKFTSDDCKLVYAED